MLCGRPPPHTHTVQQRALIPGLYEEYIPQGVSFLDDQSYLLSMYPVGANLGEPSIIVRMRRSNNGEIWRIFQLCAPVPLLVAPPGLLPRSQTVP